MKKAYLLKQNRFGTVLYEHDDLVAFKSDEGIEVYDRTQLLIPSIHAVSMYERRSLVELKDPDEDLYHSWISGGNIEEPHGMDADEVRYDEKTDIVMLRKDGNIVTCIDGRNAKPELQAAIERAGYTLP